MEVRVDEITGFVCTRALPVPSCAGRESLTVQFLEADRGHDPLLLTTDADCPGRYRTWQLT